MKYSLYYSKKSLQIAKKIDKIFDNFFEVIKEKEAANSGDYGIFFQSQLLLVASKIVALQIEHVGIGDTQTDESIVKEFKTRCNTYASDYFETRNHHAYYWMQQAIKNYANSLYNLIHS